MKVTEKQRAEKYARDQVARMRLSGFTHYESERVRTFLENAYMAGWKARRIITEDVIMKNETI